MAKLIVSAPAVPLAHSPAGGAGTGFVFAEMIASRSVHSPSFWMESPALVTVMVAADREAAPDRRRRAERDTLRAVLPTRHLRKASGIGSPENVGPHGTPRPARCQCLIGGRYVARFSGPSRTVTSATRVQPSIPEESSRSANHRAMFSADVLRPANSGWALM